MAEKVEDISLWILVHNGLLINRTGSTMYNYHSERSSNMSKNTYGEIKSFNSGAGIHGFRGETTPLLNRKGRNGNGVNTFISVTIELLFLGVSTPLRLEHPVDHGCCLCPIMVLKSNDGRPDNNKIDGIEQCTTPSIRYYLVSELLGTNGPRGPPGGEVRDGYHDNPLRGIGIRFEMPEFSGKDHAKKQRDLAGKSKVVTWEKMKHLLKAKFLCDNHKQEAFLDDHNFFQRALTIEEFVNEFDRLRMHFDATEEEEQVIAQFLGCIRPEISDGLTSKAHGIAMSASTFRPFKIV
ncbi:reverse transcriptase domain-containing protein [Artemisia annua]|uniref:Reverse transcriptase domain-containing protein n=1 Tax=Artemisia annua TaxID=35608 RepID=A0A2U1QKQ9_ARTAN|nr:reverse transcriptase domain-containing protein [Artemisia annua]